MTFRASPGGPCVGVGSYTREGRALRDVHSPGTKPGGWPVAAGHERFDLTIEALPNRLTTSPP
jgi:hypothetical protein